MTTRSILNIRQILLLLLALLFFNNSVIAREITVAFSHHQPPYIMHGAYTHSEADDSLVHNHGIEVDIFRETLKLMGHTLKIKTMDRGLVKRSLSSSKKVDIASGVNLSTDRYHYSDKIIEYVNFAITLENDNISLNSVNDLRHYSISTWPGAHTALGPAFARLYGRKGTHRNSYTQFSSQLQQNIAFWSNETEAMIIDRNIFAYYRNMLKDTLPTFRKVVMAPLFNKETPYYAAFKDKKLRGEFNDALATIRYNGTYQKIIDKYIKPEGV